MGMRAHHERLTWSMEVCSARYDELDPIATARELLDAAQARLRGWIGNWIDPLEARPLVITGTQRRQIAFTVVDVTSPCTVPGRMLAYLVGLTLAADRMFCRAEQQRLGLVAVRGPKLSELAELRALPIRHRGQPWLLEWSGIDDDALALSRGPDERLVAGQLDAAIRRRIDDARATGRGDDPLSARVFLADQAPLAARLDAGDEAALVEAAMLHRIAPPTLRALLGSARHLGVEPVFAVVDAIVFDGLFGRDLVAQISAAARSKDPEDRARALEAVTASRR